ncbi:hypothetical protein NDU88_001104 [Pleurodeles waltl]|uniref:Uncharacterized protein n=1 Tax=Pleurodeles waltl TaxID=8319 RepID=A0AAV7U6Y7_PLEWA|nr:hypothetical protein NDU88_001104 [Pleurodeles waltl]
MWLQECGREDRSRSGDEERLRRTATSDSSSPRRPERRWIARLAIKRFECMFYNSAIIIYQCFPLSWVPTFVVHVLAGVFLLGFSSFFRSWCRSQLRLRPAP